MSSRTVKKIDLPFLTEEEIEDLVERFEGCTWPHDRWVHRAHLAVAAWYLKRFPLEQATDRMRESIRRYNLTCGDPDGYHETITVFFMRAIDHYLRTDGNELSLVEIVNELVIRFDMSFLLRYFSPERLWSQTAKSAWLEPDLLPLLNFDSVDTQSFIAKNETT